MALGFEVPTSTVNNSFSATLTADGALTGVNISDFRLKGVDNSTLTLDNNNTTLTQVDTNHWRLDIELTGTYDADYFVRVRRNQVQEDGANVPSSSLDSSTFRIDSSFTPPPPALPGISMIAEQNILVLTDYHLPVEITGDPDEVTVTGDLEYFDYDWDASNNRVDLRGHPRTLVSGKQWHVRAVWNHPYLVLERDIVHNVIRSAPVLDVLPQIHLYRDVDVNIDILVQNNPGNIEAAGLLLGWGKEDIEEGVKINGQISSDNIFTAAGGDLKITAPHQGGTPVVRNYPFVIEPGTPPAIVNPRWYPKGNYGEVSFDDVNHAIGYEWTLEEGEGAEWNPFSDSRPVINPSEVKVTPGDLEATVSFPVVAGATAYEYMLESASHNVGWTRAIITVANNMITTIIPDMQDGVEYILRIRVGSPWIGEAIAISISGGRLAYSIHDDGADSYLYVFHTGVPNGGTAPRIKRILLPTGNTEPRGVAIHGNLAYVTNDVNNDDSVYVFNHADTDDGDRATVVSRFPESSSESFGAIGVFGDELYVARNSLFYAEVYAFDRNSTNGQPLTQLRRIKRTGSSVADFVGITCLEYEVFLLSISPSNRGLSSYERTATDPPNNYTFTTGHYEGVSVVGAIFYGIDSSAERITVFKRDPDSLSRSLEIKTIQNPSGLTNAVGLDIPSARG